MPYHIFCLYPHFLDNQQKKHAPAEKGPESVLLPSTKGRQGMNLHVDALPVKGDRDLKAFPLQILGKRQGLFLFPMDEGDFSHGKV